MEAKESNENQNLNEDQLPETELEPELEDDEMPKSQHDIAMGLHSESTRPTGMRPPRGSTRPTGNSSEGEDTALG